ncbi:MAG: DUF547 domain-containing protein [Bacteroidota bacterium]
MKRLTILITLFLTVLGSLQSSASAGEIPSHRLWDELVKANVSKKGIVDYEGFIKEKEKLQQYLDLLSQNPPDKKVWSKEEQLAYWINAYNAFTVKLIIDHYPVKSIKDLAPVNIPYVSTVWHMKFFKIGGKDSSLDEIEHKILRKQFEEPRIHFAVNCASKSCPILRNESYEAAKIDKQLDEQTRLFLSDESRNKIAKDQVMVSKIFSWFKKDFSKSGGVITFIDKHTKTSVSKSAKVSFLPYDWTLNNEPIEQ